MAYDFIRGLVDVRSQLATNTKGGPNQSHPLSQKTGCVIHYNGPAVPLSTNDLDQIKADARYHVSEDWSSDGSGLYGDGIMYHVMIGRDGTKYLCRDLEAVLWHCAAWPQNGTALSIQVIMGDGQHATPAQLRAVTEVCDDWFAAGHGDKKTQLWGHQELSQTSCPGTLMGDFVKPYRAGTITSTPAAPAPVAPAPAKPLEIGAPNGKKIVLGFAQFYQSLNQDQVNLRLLGWPTSNEFVAKLEGQEQPYTYQVFERGVLTWRGGNAKPWDIYQLPEPGPEADRARDYAKQNGL